MLIVAGFHICGDYFLLFRVFVPSIKIILFNNDGRLTLNVDLRPAFVCTQKCGFRTSNVSQVILSIIYDEIQLHSWAISHY